MKTALFPALLILAVGSAAGRVLDICRSSGGGAWLALRNDTDSGEVSSSCLYRIVDGTVLFTDTLGFVRSDAAHCRLVRRHDGGCFAAASTGTGYTAISLRAYGPDGSLEWELMEDGECYDTPQGLLASDDGGVLMLWDSWSAGRGLWVLRVTREGDPVWKTFALPTAHPFHTAFCRAGDDGCFVAAATVAAMDEFVAVALDSGGDPNEYINVGVIENLGGCAPMTAGSSDGGIVSLWSDTPVPEFLDELVVIFHHGSPESRWFSLDSLSGAVLLKATEDGLIAAGGEGSPWVCTTDLTGAVTWHHRFGTAFVPAALDEGGGFILVAGDTGQGSFAACAEPGGGEVWSVILAE